MKGWLEIVLFSVEWQRTKREFISYVSTQNIISVTRGLWVSLITLVNLTRKGNCGTQIFYRILTNPSVYISCLIQTFTLYDALHICTCPRFWDMDWRTSHYICLCRYLVFHSFIFIDFSIHSKSRTV